MIIDVTVDYKDEDGVAKYAPIAGIVKLEVSDCNNGLQCPGWDQNAIKLFYTPKITLDRDDYEPW